VKNKIISDIKFLSLGLNELIIDIPLEDITFHSIELVEGNQIILHRILEDLDIEYDFDDLDKVDKSKIHSLISGFMK